MALFRPLERWAMTDGSIDNRRIVRKLADEANALDLVAESRRAASFGRSAAQRLEVVGRQVVNEPPGVEVFDQQFAGHVVILEQPRAQFAGVNKVSLGLEEAITTAADRQAVLVRLRLAAGVQVVAFSLIFLKRRLPIVDLAEVMQAVLNLYGPLARAVRNHRKVRIRRRFRPLRSL